MSEPDQRAVRATGSESAEPEAPPMTIVADGSLLAGLPVELWAVIGLFTAPGV